MRVQLFVEPRSLTDLAVKTATAMEFLTPRTIGPSNKVPMHARSHLETQALIESVAWTPTATTTLTRPPIGALLTEPMLTLKTQPDGFSSLKKRAPSLHPPTFSSVAVLGLWSCSP
jgi:hypothetical protein